jgi:hypothetical protein
MRLTVSPFSPSIVSRPHFVIDRRLQRACWQPQPARLRDRMDRERAFTRVVLASGLGRVDALTAIYAAFTDHDVAGDARHRQEHDRATAEELDTHDRARQRSVRRTSEHSNEQRRRKSSLTVPTASLLRSASARDGP